MDGRWKHTPFNSVLLFQGVNAKSTYQHKGKYTQNPTQNGGGGDYDDILFALLSLLVHMTLTRSSTLRPGRPMPTPHFVRELKH